MKGLYRLTSPKRQAALEKEFTQLGLSYTIDLRDDGVWISVSGNPKLKPSGVILPFGIKVKGCKNWKREESRRSSLPCLNPEPHIFPDHDKRYQEYRNDRT